MPKIKKSEKQYKTLRNRLERIIAENREQLENSVRQIAIRTHWEVGECLHSSIGDEKSEYGRKIIKTLADDLELHTTVLYRSLKFFRTYPGGLPSTSEFKALPWSSHAELLPVTDEEERLYYIHRAAQENWSAKMLRKAIKADEYGAGAEKKKKSHDSGLLPRPVPGLYTYEAFLERVVDGDTIIVRIDLGFDVLKRERIRLRGIDAPEIEPMKVRKPKNS